MKEFNKELSLIKDAKYKKELITFIEDKFNIDLSSKEAKRKLTQTEEQRWEQLSDE